MLSEQVFRSHCLAGSDIAASWCAFPIPQKIPRTTGRVRAKTVRRTNLNSGVSQWFLWHLGPPEWQLQKLIPPGYWSRFAFIRIFRRMPVCQRYFTMTVVRNGCRTECQIPSEPFLEKTRSRMKETERCYKGRSTRRGAWTLGPPESRIHRFYGRQIGGNKSQTSSLRSRGTCEIRVDPMT